MFQKIKGIWYSLSADEQKEWKRAAEVTWCYMWRGTTILFVIFLLVTTLFLALFSQLAGLYGALAMFLFSVPVFMFTIWQSLRKQYKTFYFALYEGSKHVHADIQHVIPFMWCLLWRKFLIVFPIAAVGTYLSILATGDTQTGMILGDYIYYLTSIPVLIITTKMALKKEYKKFRLGIIETK